MVDNRRQNRRIEALPGSLHVQRVKCGKKKCRCARGELHEAVYRFWRERGRLRKAYVRRRDLEAVKAGIEKWRECERVKQALLSSPEADEQRAQIRAMFRDAGVPVPRSMYPRRAFEPEPDVRLEELAGRLVEPIPMIMFRFSK
jgi:hypothetical protein